MSIYPEFAALLEQYLQRTDRSAAWLAKGLKVDASTVAKWRSGDSRPKDPETVIRMADLLGVHNKAERETLLRAAGYGYQETAVAGATPAPSAQVFGWHPSAILLVEMGGGDRCVGATALDRSLDKIRVGHGEAPVGWGWRCWWA